MNRIPLSIPEIGFISGTRAMIGAGAALLLADRLSDEQRRAVGWTLVAIGALSSIPIVVQLFGSSRDEDANEPSRQPSARRFGSYAREEQHA